MHVISLAGSEHQKSRLRNGHKVRVKHGAGFNVIVNPSTYHLVSKAFNKKKGTSMQLSPEEIEMNKGPSPEMQRQIMGHNEHLILPNVMGQLVKGSGIGDFFKNMGNKIKGAYETVRDTVRTPIEKAIVNPIKNAYDKNVPESIRKDISTGAKIMSPQYLLVDAVKKVREGKNPVEIFNQYRDDLKHLNNTKNKVIKSNPILTEAYKKGVMATASLGSAALGTTLGLNPATGALAGAAGSLAARELLKAEGYGLHHIVAMGSRHHYDKYKKHHRAIGGALGFHHITDFFKNAGNKVKDIVHNTFIPVVKQGAQETKQGALKVHNWLLDHPEFANAIKEHGSKLAGLLAKEGVRYLTGNDDVADIAGDVGNDASYLGAEQLGYGLSGRRKPTKILDEGYNAMHPTTADYNKMVKETGDKLDARKASEMAKVSDAENRKRNKIEQDMLISQHNSKIASDKRNQNMEFDSAMKHQERENKALKAAQLKANKEQMQKTQDKYKNRSATNTPIDTSNKPGFFTSLLNWFSGKKTQPDYENQVSYQSDPSTWKDKYGSGLYGGTLASGYHPSGNEQSACGNGLTAGMSGGGAYGCGSHGNGLGTGLYAGKMRGTGSFHSFDSMKDAANGYAHSNAMLGEMSGLTVHGQHYQRPIQKYYDGDNAPPSRGTGMHPHTSHHIHQNDHLHHRGHTKNPYDMNLIRGMGTLIEHDAHLPPALTSQPYGANFHMQFQLPPQYQKYNDGTYTY